MGQLALAGNHVASGDIHGIVERHGHGHGRKRFGHVAVGGDDAGYGAGAAARQHGHDIAGACHATYDAAAIAAEVGIRSIDVLHWHPQAFGVSHRRHGNGLEQVHQGRALIPRHVGGLLHHVVAEQGGDGDEIEVVHRQLGGEGEIVVADGIEHRLLVAHVVHLVDGDDQVPDAEELGDVAVPPGLRQHAVVGVDEDDGDIAGGGAGDHVARVLLVAGRVGDDELAPGGGEVAVGDIDGDALLALRLQAIDQERKVHAAPLGADGAAVLANGFELILVDHPRVVQQTANQRALAVIDAAAGEKTEDFLALVLLEVSEDVRLDEIGGVAHGCAPLTEKREDAFLDDAHSRGE